jgi:DNA-binding transcriptional LysR family regulator
MEGDSLALVVGANHPWTGKTRITPKLLTGPCWILRERGSGTRSMFEAALKTFAVKLSDLDIRLELPSNEAVADFRSVAGNTDGTAAFTFIRTCAAFKNAAKSR